MGHKNLGDKSEATIRLLLLLVLLSSAFSGHAFELIAHRGNSCGATENSIEAVKDSWSLGASAIELDVRVQTLAKA
ncbi:MAG: hypothetical protein KBT63_07555 [Porticoccaceae bacterium]|nr:hypothetical protein [Porticoccaceae bacterium]